MCADGHVPAVVLCHSQALGLGLPYLITRSNQVCSLSPIKTHNRQFLNNSHSWANNVCGSQNISREYTSPTILINLVDRG
jgi:hypothetical protein